MTELQKTRAENLEDLRRQSSTTLFVIGGGIHGAAFARLAGLNGIPCVLAERDDYASGTSSRSSKMAHGGLRYLENYDFAQVFEGVRAREDLFATAPHLVRPEPFLIPVRAGDWPFRLKLGLGLHLYDLMVQEPSRHHRYIPRHRLDFTGFHTGHTDLDGCYLYTDGLMDDARLTLESILHARQLGARCLNYLEVVGVEKAGEKFTVHCQDGLGGEMLTIVADLVVNCAGPWVPHIGQPEAAALASQIRYSAGVHLLFCCPWNAPSLFLPLPDRSRYYFVWPHPGGTMVGTTEREVARAEYDPMPTTAEITEVLERLERDLPDAELNRDTLYYAFSGIRTLPLRGTQSGTARLSRRHLWQSVGGVLTLLGGKFTTANLTAWEGFQRAAQTLSIAHSLKSLENVPYPGAGTESERAEVAKALRSSGLSEEAADLLLSRYGIRARLLLTEPDALEPIAPYLWRGEIDLALREEQAETIEDLLRRRTGVEYLPDAPLQALDGILPLLRTYRAGARIDIEAETYRHRLLRLQQRLEAK